MSLGCVVRTATHPAAAAPPPSRVQGGRSALENLLWQLIPAKLGAFKYANADVPCPLEPGIGESIAAGDALIGDRNLSAPGTTGFGQCPCCSPPPGSCAAGSSCVAPSAASTCGDLNKALSEPIQATLDDWNNAYECG